VCTSIKRKVNYTAGHVMSSTVILIELVVSVKLKFKVKTVRTSFLGNSPSESRWRTVPLMSQEKIPRDTQEKCGRRKMKSASKSTRRSNDEHSLSRSCTQSLNTFHLWKGQWFVQLSEISHRVIPACFLVDLFQPFP